MGELFNITILACYCAVLIVIFVVFFEQTKMKKNMVLGVSVPEKDLSDPEVSAIICHCRRNLILVLSVLMVLLLLIPLISSDAVIFFVLSLWLLLALLLPAVVFHYDYRRMMTWKTLHIEGNDDDKYWLWGMFYRNPQNMHLTVKKRTGVGVTLNIGRHGIKQLISVIFLLILLIPFFSFGLMVADFHPVTTEVTDQGISVRHLGYREEVDYQDMENAVFYAEAPRCRRVVGMAMGSLNKGKFEVQGYGSCEVCMNCDAPAYVIIETKAKNYLFSTDSRAEAEEIVDRVQENI